MHAEQVARFVVGRILRQALAQGGGRGRTFQRARQVELRADALGFGVAGEIGRQGVELRLRRIGFARARERQGEVELEFGLVGMRCNVLLQADDCLLRCFLRCSGFCCGRGAGLRLAQVLFDECAHARLGQRAHEAVDHLPVLHENDRRQAADAEGAGQLHLLVGVDLGELELAAVAVDDFLEDRAERLARTAPVGPEIEQHGRAQRRLHDLGLEVLFGGVEYLEGIGHNVSQISGKPISMMHRTFCKRAACMLAGSRARAERGASSRRVQC